MKPKTPESATPVNAVPPLNDVTTKKFFRAVQQRLGRKLERLSMSFCSIVWQRPSQTASSVSRYLAKCEKLRQLECNFVQFYPVGESLPTLSSKSGQPNTDFSEPVHWLVNALVAGCPRLEELSVIGLTLTAAQAYNLGIQIRDRWRGTSLRVHLWRTGHDEYQPTEIIYNVIHALKNDKKLVADYIGGYRETVLIRRRKNLCGLVSQFRDMKMGLPNILPLLCPSNQDLFSFEESACDDEVDQTKGESDRMEEVCANLPPSLSSLFGLTAFDYSIMRAHSWDSNEF